MQVLDVMTANPIMIEPDISITDAAKRMRDTDCGVLPVGSLDNIQGMITDRDIVLWVVAAKLDPDATKVSDIMSTDTLTCREEDSLEKAADVMSLNGVRRLVVNNNEGVVTGIVSISDLMKNIGDEAITDDVMHHVLKYA